MLDTLINALQRAQQLLSAPVDTRTCDDIGIDINRRKHARYILSDSDRVIYLPDTRTMGDAPPLTPPGVWVRIDPQSSPAGPLAGEYATDGLEGLLRPIDYRSTDDDDFSWWVHCGVC